MARGKLTFRQRDLVAAIRAVKVAGQEIAKVEIDSEGKISILTTSALKRTELAKAVDYNEWDIVLQDWR